MKTGVFILIVGANRSEPDQPLGLCFTTIYQYVSQCPMILQTDREGFIELHGCAGRSFPSLFTNPDIYF